MEYSIGIARNLGLEKHSIKTIKDAGILHDIGKIGIRDYVLLKKGRLTDEEFNEIKKHPVISGNIVKTISSLQEAAMIARQHHERFDGKGYPDRLKEKEIHIGARCMAVADAYDAMTSTRPYRQSLGHDSALEELRKGSGTQFDPKCVDAFLRFLSEKMSAENEQGCVSEELMVTSLDIH